MTRPSSYHRSSEAAHSEQFATFDSGAINAPVAPGSSEIMLPILLFARALAMFERDEFPAASSWPLRSCAAGPAGRQHHSDHRPYPPFGGESEGCANAPPLPA